MTFKQIDSYMAQNLNQSAFYETKKGAQGGSVAIRAHHSLELALLRLLNIRNARAQANLCTRIPHSERTHPKTHLMNTHLARRHVPRHKRQLRFALMPRRRHGPDLPHECLERVAGLDGRGEAHAEEAQRRGVAAADCADKRAGGEAERREPV